MKAVEKVRAGNFTYLLAIGGGSVIDGLNLFLQQVSLQKIQLIYLDGV